MGWEGFGKRGKSWEVQAEGMARGKRQEWEVRGEAPAGYNGAIIFILLLLVLKSVVENDDHAKIKRGSFAPFSNRRRRGGVRARRVR